LCETEIEQYPPSTKCIGLDLIKSYLVDSNNNEVAKKYYRTQRKLRKASKKLSRAVKGSSNRVKAKIKLAHHERITNLRDDFAQAINQDSPENGIICIENLRVANMIKTTSWLSVSDASWAKFVDMLEYKALWHNRIVRKVGVFFLPVRRVTSVVLLIQK